MTTSPAWYAPVARANHIALTTYRKSGAGVTTPVWFSRKGDRLYIFTLVGSGKVKRLRHTSRVMLAPCTMTGKITGPTVPAEAHFITDPRELRRARFAIWRKYHVAMFGVQLLNAIQRWKGNARATTLYIALEEQPFEVTHDQTPDHHPQTTHLA